MKDAKPESPINNLVDGAITHEHGMNMYMYIHTLTKFHGSPLTSKTDNVSLVAAFGKC